MNKNNIFTVLIDQFDNIPLKKNNAKFLLRVIEETVTNFSISLLNSKILLDNLNKGEKEKLSFFITHFFKPLSTLEFQNVNNRVTRYKTKNIIKMAYNWFLCRTLNTLVSAGVEIVSDTISKSLGLNKNYESNTFKNYLPELKTSTPVPNKLKDSLEVNSLKNFLKELIQLIKKCGYNKTVFFFDKIDEYPSLEGKVGKIVEFIKEIMQDNNLLQAPDGSFVFSIWKKIRLELNSEGIRFDKFRPIDVTWEAEEIINLINLRLKYFSNNNTSIDIKTIVPNKEKYDLITFISNNSPRDMLRLLAYIYDEQSIINPDSKIFSDASIDQGIMKFIRGYDFYSLYPKSGRVDDINNIVNKMLQVAMTEFQGTDYASRFKVNPNKANSHIKIMKDYGLIKDEQNNVSKAKKFVVIDPKIVYLINNNVSSL